VQKPSAEEKGPVLTQSRDRGGQCAFQASVQRDVQPYRPAKYSVISRAGHYKQSLP
jgi:hypothetical protein